MISTRNLSGLPDVGELRRLCQSLAMLDAILSPEWQYRSYSFNAHWNDGEEMASMRNGSGDEYFALFKEHGVILKGFDHEAIMSPYAERPPRVWPGVLEEVPDDFASFLADPAFVREDTTFCIWRLRTDEAWQIGNVDFPPGPDPDGSARLLADLDGKPSTYKIWAEDYYEVPISLEAVIHIYKHRPLTSKIVRALNEDCSMEDLVEDIKEIGYPAGSQT